jgi:hypothetical protein
MPNPYIDILPKPPAEDQREAVEALRQFAEALQQYPGKDKDVEVPVTVHPENGPEQVVRVHVSVYVPKTDYANLVLVARCRGENGFPVTIDPYFAGGTFPDGMPPCQGRQELDDALKEFAHSSEVLALLDYMLRHAQPRQNLAKGAEPP